MISTEDNNVPRLMVHYSLAIYSVESLPADIYVGVTGFVMGAMIGMKVLSTAPMTFGRIAFCTNPNLVSTSLRPVGKLQ